MPNPYMGTELVVPDSLQALPALMPENAKPLRGLVWRHDALKVLEAGMPGLVSGAGQGFIIELQNQPLGRGGDLETGAEAWVTQSGRGRRHDISIGVRFWARRR